MKDVLKKIWSYLDGKKTAAGGIGGLLTGLLYIAKGFWPEAIPEEVITGMSIISGTTLLTGGTHKVVKNYDKITNTINGIGKKENFNH